MNGRELALLDEVKEAMRGTVRLNITPTFTHGDAIQIEHKVNGRWKKAGVLIFPPDDGSITDVFAMLMSFREHEAAAS